MAPRGAHWLLLLALTGVLHQVCLGQEATEVVAAAQSAAEGTEAQLSTAGSVLLDTPADGQLTGSDTLAEPEVGATAVCVPPIKEKSHCSSMCPKGGCITGLTVSVTSQATAGRARGRGKPDRPGADDPPPLGGTPPVTCDVGSTGTNMKYLPDDKRFTTKNFYHSCLGNAAVGCNHPDNTGDPNKIKSASSCCSCFLYSQFFDPPSKPYTKFQTASHSYYKNKDKVDPANNQWHMLVMPAEACPGVEHYNNPNSNLKIKCPGEDIWAAAQSVIDASKLNDEYLWGLAINPVHRRGQHQMHVHIGQVFHSLLGAVVYGYHTEKKSSFELVCTGNKLDSCKFATTSAATNVKVTVKVGTSNNRMTTPDLAEPFKTAYPKLDNSDPNGPVLFSSTLVLPMPFVRYGGWAIIRNPAGPAECFFNPQTDEELANACQ